MMTKKEAIEYINTYHTQECIDNIGMETLIELNMNGDFNWLN